MAEKKLIVPGESDPGALARRAALDAADAARGTNRNLELLRQRRFDRPLSKTQAKAVQGPFRRNRRRAPTAAEVEALEKELERIRAEYEQLDSGGNL